MTRFVDRGAITAAYVGIGMSVTVAISFLLIIPIEPIVWLLTIPTGLLIGYYANQRSNRRAGPWSRILMNGVFAALITGVTAAVLLLGRQGAVLLRRQRLSRRECRRSDRLLVRARLRLPAIPARRGRRAGGPLEAAGVTDAATFTAFYWSQQFTVAGLLVVVTTIGGLGGAVLYGVFRPKPVAPATGAASESASRGLKASARPGTAA